MLKNLHNKVYDIITIKIIHFLKICLSIFKIFPSRKSAFGSSHLKALNSRIYGYLQKQDVRNSTAQLQRC